MGDIIEIVRGSGKRSYKARVRRVGEKLLTKTFRLKTEATKWITLMESECVKGKALPRRNLHTVREAIER
jgi:hypothetical protein